MIFRTENEGAYNPIRAHLSLNVVNLNEEQRLNHIYNDLEKCSFNPAISRCIVFCSSRKLTEELADKFNTLCENNPTYRNMTGFFHAGMSGDEREDQYKSYLVGRSVILFATKAFGMGLDIPNIHFIYHIDAPSSLEDFLQEVGRAGRDPGYLKKAGFGIKNPIKCTLFIQSDDFKKQKDRLHRSQLSWSELNDILEEIVRFVKNVRPKLISDKKAIPLPLDFLKNSIFFREKQDLLNRQRLGLYWLERLNRIRLGQYLSAYLEFKTDIKDESEIELSQIETDLLLVLKSHKSKSKNSSAFLVPITQVMKVTESVSMNEIFKIISSLYRKKIACLNHAIHCSITKKREREIRYFQYKEELSPNLKAGYDFINKVLISIPAGGRNILDNDGLDNYIDEIFSDWAGNPPWDWIDNEKKMDKFIKDSADFKRKYRRKTLFRVIDNIPGVTVKTHFDNDEVSYIIRKEKDDWSDWLEDHQISSLKLLNMIFEAQSANESLELVAVLANIGAENPNLDYLEGILLFLRGMGFIKFSGPLVPMAVEMYLLAIDEIDITDQQKNDYKVFKDFQNNRELKILRLYALETLAVIKKVEKQSIFIEEYFDCTSTGDVRNLIEKYLEEINPNHNILSEIRSEALDRLVHGEENEDGESDGGLNDEQLEVYRAPFEQSTVVIAGPGSGKTHTLLLRLARLVHEQGTPPNEILVLAYNRAVVTELKHRLSELFSRLGYRTLIHRLNIFTYHSFIKRCIPDISDLIPLGTNTEGDVWVEKFLERIQSEPGLVINTLGSLRYVFIDEFQDIIRPRYEMIKQIANPKKTSITVIGDPDQSIYGYDRVKYGKPPDPREADTFFNLFEEEYSASRYSLKKNYRSFPDIITESQNLISLNSERLELPLEHVREPNSDWKIRNYVEKIDSDSQNKWYKKLYNLIDEKNGQGEYYKDIAVLVRSNNDVAYRVDEFMNTLEKEYEEKISIRIQGASSGFLQSREIAYYMDIFNNKTDKKLPPNFPSIFLDTILKKCNEFQNWDINILELLVALVFEFNENHGEDHTFGELFEFIAHLGTSRDESHLYKIYYYWKDIIIPDDKNKIQLIFSNFHKIKGLEFDCVFIPPSFSDLPMGRYGKNSLQSVIEEERRVFYVGYSRAKDRLVILEWERERCLKQPIPTKWSLPERYKAQIGKGVEQTLQNILISNNADERLIRQYFSFNNCEAFISYYNTKISKGDSVTIKKIGGRWLIIHEMKPIAMCSSTLTRYLQDNHMYSGLRIASIVRYTLEESLQYDERNDKNYTNRWSPYFKSQGWIYVPEIFGYMKSNNIN